MAFTALIVIVVFTSLISYNAFRDTQLFDKLLFSAYRIKHNKEYYRFISNVLVHADLTHLLFNMFSLYFLGEALEFYLFFDYGPQIGEMHFLLIYFLGGIMANVYSFYKHQDNPSYRSVGASGAVSAVIFATIMWDPDLPLMLFFIPIEIPAYIFGPIYLAFEYWAHKKGGTGIAHDAHIGGAIFGVIYVLIINIDKGKEFLSHIF
jgi:membrane associated rhomboid family serine protease